MENRTLEFTVPGKPFGKERPRFMHHAYTPEKTKAYEKMVALEYRRHFKKEELFGYIRLEVDAYYAVNKSDSLKTKEKKVNGIIRPDKKPDADNILKVIADALNGVAYSDDKQIVEVSLVKHYDYNPRVEVRLKEINQC